MIEVQTLLAQKGVKGSHRGMESEEDQQFLWTEDDRIDFQSASGEPHGRHLGADDTFCVPDLARDVEGAGSLR